MHSHHIQNLTTLDERQLLLADKLREDETPLALIEAITNSDNFDCNYLFEWRYKQLTPLAWAVLNSNDQLVASFLNKGANPLFGSEMSAFRLSVQRKLWRYVERFFLLEKFTPSAEDINFSLYGLLKNYNESLQVLLSVLLTQKLDPNKFIHEESGEYTLFNALVSSALSENQKKECAKLFLKLFDDNYLNPNLVKQIFTELVTAGDITILSLLLEMPVFIKDKKILGYLFTHAIYHRLNDTYSYDKKFLMRLIMANADVHQKLDVKYSSVCPLETAISRAEPIITTNLLYRGAKKVSFEYIRRLNNNRLHNYLNAEKLCLEMIQYKFLLAMIFRNRNLNNANNPLNKLSFEILFNILEYTVSTLLKENFQLTGKIFVKHAYSFFNQVDLQQQRIVTKRDQQLYFDRDAKANPLAPHCISTQESALITVGLKQSP